MSVFNGFDNLVQNIFINLDPDIKLKKNGLLFDENVSWLTKYPLRWC